MKILLLLILPLLIYAESLKSILDFATKNSDLVISKKYSQEAKAKDIKSKEGAYYPTLDIGAYYQSVEQKTPILSGDIYSGYAKAAYDIYDGGKRSALLNQSQKEYKSSSFDTNSIKNTLSLEIVKDFFSIKSLKASLSARDEAKDSLKEQLTRMKRFVIAKVATQDDVDRLQAAYDTNIYEMESTKLQIATLKMMLELKVGKDILTLDDSRFVEFKESELELIDSVKSLMAKKNALVAGSQAVDSIYYPQIRIEDRFSAFGYNRTDHNVAKGDDTQNILLLSLNMRLFDNGIEKNAKEALQIEAQALDTQLTYNKKTQNMHYKLAILRIQTVKMKIKSSKSALVSSTSAFEIISKKYDAGIVDNVVYLDALSSKTNAQALYQRSLNELEASYGAYYFYAGKNIEEFLE